MRPQVGGNLRNGAPWAEDGGDPRRFKSGAILFWNDPASHNQDIGRASVAETRNNLRQEGGVCARED